MLATRIASSLAVVLGLAGIGCGAEVERSERTEAVEQGLTDTLACPLTAMRRLSAYDPFESGLLARGCVPSAHVLSSVQDVDGNTWDWKAVDCPASESVGDWVSQYQGVSPYSPSYIYFGICRPMNESHVAVKYDPTCQTCICARCQ